MQQASFSQSSSKVIFKKRCSPSLSWEAHVQYLPHQQRRIYFQVIFFFFGWRPSFEVLSPSLVTSYELCTESPCALGQAYPQKILDGTVESFGMQWSFACCKV